MKHLGWANALILALPLLTYPNVRCAAVLRIFAFYLQPKRFLVITSQEVAI